MGSSSCSSSAAESSAIGAQESLPKIRLGDLLAEVFRRAIPSAQRETSDCLSSAQDKRKKALVTMSGDFEAP